MAQLRIADLDFDTIKQNLIDFLKTQDTFTDYDFEGSGLSVLLDVLAYNTHYNAYLASMLANEMFLDSAVKRSSAVSLAKHMGYVPRSARSAKAVINLTVQNPTDTPSTLTLDQYTEFTSTANGVAYNFLTSKATTIEPAGGVYLFEDVELAEGSYQTYNYVVVSPGPDEKYVIPNETVDTTSITVTVQTSAADSTSSVYTLATDVSILDGSSKVYFIEENTAGKYEIYFGDGILGKKLEASNIVRIEYIATSGAAVDVSNLVDQTFTCTSTVGGSTDFIVETVSNSRGGRDKETITEIKFNASRYATSQNRAVTSNDFESLILQQFTQAEAVKVWGGEDNDPPAYGKVFICLKPFTGYVISEADKTFITNTILKDKQVVTIVPEFIDPEYLYVNLGVNVKYNPLLTTSTTTQIAEQVRSVVNTYFDQELGQFNKPFYYSKLLQLITDYNTSIVAATMKVMLQLRLNPSLNNPNSYLLANNLRFGNKIHPGDLQSTRFYVTVNNVITPAQFKDVPDTTPADYNGTGTVQIYNPDTSNVIVSSAGVVNYATGEVSINAFTPTGYPSGVSDVRLTVEIQEQAMDLATNKNQLLIIDDSSANTAVNLLSGLSINVTPI